MKRLSAGPALVAAAFLLPGAAHASLIEFSVSGIVADGKDERGLFTTYDEPANAIVGRPYTMSFTIDTSQLIHTVSATAHIAHSDPDGPLDFRGKATIGTQSYAWSLNWGDAVTARLGPGSSAAMDIDGQFGWNDWGTATIGVFPQGPGVPRLDGFAFEQRIVYTDFSDPDGYNVRFDVTHLVPRSPDDNGAETYRTHFTGTVDSALWQVSPVPEPAHYGMLIGGLAVLAAAGMRTRRREVADAE